MDKTIRKSVRAATQTIAVVATLWIAVATSSCTKGLNDNSNETGLSTGELTEMSLELTSANDPATSAGSVSRSLTNEQQSMILNATVLQFKDNILIRRQEASVSQVSDGKYNVRTVLKSSQTMDELFDIMIIANIDTMTFDRFDGKTKETLKTGLTFTTIPNPGNDKWETKGIPMWGEIKGLLVKATANNPKIRMLRALSRIRVGVGMYDGITDDWEPDPDCDGNFKMEQLYLMNVNDRAAIVPAATSIDNKNEYLVSGPTIPAWAKLLGTNVSTAFDYSAYIVDQTKCDNSIFISEVKNKDVEPNKRMSLIIGGSYKGGPTTYYRVDPLHYYSTADQFFVYDVLRNTNSIFSIQRVLGPGLSTPQAAYDAGTSQQIILALNPIDPDDMSDLNDIIFTNNCYIATDISELQVFSTSTRDWQSIHLATVKTTFRPWEKATVSGSEGILIDPDFTLQSGVAKRISVSIPPYSPQTDNTYRVTIRSGNLEKVIKIIVQPPIDAHFEMLPFYNAYSIVISTTGINANVDWITLSKNSTYNPNDQQTKYIEINNDNNANLFMYINENLVTDDATPRTAQALVKRTNNRGTIRVIIEQLNLTDMVIGFFGGDSWTKVNGMAGYPSLLALETIEEYRTALSNAETMETLIPWGFYNNPSSIATNSEFGRKNTEFMGNRNDHGIEGELSSKNTYAARYCLNKNRDKDGNGIIEGNEVVWYLPSVNQLVAIWMAKGIHYDPPYTDPSNSSYWSITQYNHTTTWAVEFSPNPTAVAYTASMANNGNVRCVRDRY